MTEDPVVWIIMSILPCQSGCVRASIALNPSGQGKNNTDRSSKVDWTKALAFVPGLCVFVVKTIQFSVIPSQGVPIFSPVRCPKYRSPPWHPPCVTWHCKSSALQAPRHQSCPTRYPCIASPTTCNGTQNAHDLVYRSRQNCWS